MLVTKPLGDAPVQKCSSRSPSGMISARHEAPSGMISCRNALHYTSDRCSADLYRCTQIFTVQCDNRRSTTRLQIHSKLYLTDILQVLYRYLLMLFCLFFFRDTTAAPNSKPTARCTLHCSVCSPAAPLPQRQSLCAPGRAAPESPPLFYMLFFRFIRAVQNIYRLSAAPSTYYSCPSSNAVIYSSTVV